MNSVITTDEWLAALREAMTPTEAVAGWKTAAELARAMHVSIRTMCKTLGELKAEGRLQVQYVMRPCIDGKLARHPVYAIRPGERPS